jgi:hypothetical protein
MKSFVRSFTIAAVLVIFSPDLSAQWIALPTPTTSVKNQHWVTFSFYDLSIPVGKGKFVFTSWHFTNGIDGGQSHFYYSDDNFSSYKLLFNTNSGPAVSHSIPKICSINDSTIAFVEWDVQNMCRYTTDKWKTLKYVHHTGSNSQGPAFSPTCVFFSLRELTVN